MEAYGKLIESIATILWPVLVAVIIYGFRDTAREIFASAKSRKFTVKVAGQELTMEEANDQQTRIIADVQERLLKVEKTINTLHPGQVVNVSPQVTAWPNIVHSILWVDDEPRNNATVIKYLSDLGIQVTLALSTNDGMSKFSAKKFDRVITDMGRTEEHGGYRATAGLDIIKAIRTLDQAVPIIVFSSSRAARQYRQEALAAGAKEITSSFTTLIDTLDLGLPENQG